MDTQFKQALKAQAHHLKPIIYLGVKGLTPSVIEEVRLALLAHELIKIKLRGIEKNARKDVSSSLCEAVNAVLIQIIGNTAVMYKKNPHKPKEHTR